MLVVSGFRPVQSYDNRNVSTNNSRQTLFQSRPDMISFTSNVEAANKVDALVGKYLNGEYADVLGKNFETLLENITSFLEQHRVLFKFENLKDHKISIKAGSVLDESNNGIVKVAYNVNLVDIKTGQHIFYFPQKCMDLKEIYRFGVTKSESLIGVLDEIFSGKTQLLNRYNLGKDKWSPTLKEQISKTREVMSSFYREFINSDFGHDNLNAKAQSLQNSIIRLIPDPKAV